MAPFKQWPNFQFLELGTPVNDYKTFRDHIILSQFKSENDYEYILSLRLPFPESQ